MEERGVLWADAIDLEAEVLLNDLKILKKVMMMCVVGVTIVSLNVGASIDGLLDCLGCLLRILRREEVGCRLLIYTY